MSEHKYFRLLDDGESLTKGDVFFDPVSEGLTEIAGCVWVGKKFGSHLVPHLRPVVVDEWVSYAERKPTEADGCHSPFYYNAGLVHTYFNDGSHGLHRWDENLDGQGVTHWRRITPPEPVIARVKVGGHEVVPDHSGNLKVGCQEVTSEQFEEITKQRAAAMKEGK